MLPNRPLIATRACVCGGLISPFFRGLNKKSFSGTKQMDPDNIDPDNISPSADQTPTSCFDESTTEEKAKLMAFARTVNFLHEMLAMHDRICEMSSDPFEPIAYDE